MAKKLVSLWLPRLKTLLTLTIMKKWEKQNSTIPARVTLLLWMMYGSESELRVAWGNISHIVRLRGENINFNTNNLEYLNFGLKWEQSFLKWKISETRVYLCEFYYSAICTMEVSWILINNPEVYFVSKTSLWGKKVKSSLIMSRSTSIARKMTCETHNMLLPLGAVGEKSFSDPTSDAWKTEEKHN